MKTLVVVAAAVTALLTRAGAVAAQDTSRVTQPPPAAAPADPNAISPGMTEADVRSRWGDPIAVRTTGQWKYLFYRNEDERHIGWLDTVFLQNGQVVDCIARGAGHVYTGQSSAPPGRYPQATPPTRPNASDSARGAVTGVHITP